MEPSPRGPPWWGQWLSSAPMRPLQCVSATLRWPARTVFTRPSGSSPTSATLYQTASSPVSVAMTLSSDRNPSAVLDAREIRHVAVERREIVDVELVQMMVTTRPGHHLHQLDRRAQEAVQT